MFFAISIFIFIYRRQTKSTFSLLLLILIHFLVLLFCFLLRFFLFEQVLALGSVVASALFVPHYVSSGSSGGELSGPPPLESSSSTESRKTYRNIIGAQNEGRVRDHFNQAVDVDDYFFVFDRRNFELRVLEQKGLLQDRLFELMLAQSNLESIYKVCLHNGQTYIRREAYEFLQEKVKPFSDPSFADQRALMSANQNSFTQQLNEHGRNSEIYQEFYRHFTDEDVRRSLGLPLP